MATINGVFMVDHSEGRAGEMLNTPSDVNKPSSSGLPKSSQVKVWQKIWGLTQISARALPSRVDSIFYFIFLKAAYNVFFFFC